MGDSRTTTFATLFQAERYVGRTTSNTFAPLNSILTVIGGGGDATFVNITSTLSTAGYTPGDIIGFSTGISTVLSDYYALILALYNVTSTTFSSIDAALSSPVILNFSTLSTGIASTFEQFSTLSNAAVETVGRMPVGAGQVYAGQTLSDQPVQFNSTIAQGWNWFPAGAPGGAFSTFYASSPGVYEVTSRINYTTLNSSTGLLLQLRNGSGTVIDEVVKTIRPADSTNSSNSITFQTIQSFSNDSLYMYISTLATPAATIQTLSGNVGIKFLYSSNAFV